LRTFFRSSSDAPDARGIPFRGEGIQRKRYPQRVTLDIVLEKLPGLYTSSVDTTSFERSLPDDTKEYF
jgi:hypothetical protein